MCHVSYLSHPLLPPPPHQSALPRLSPAIFPCSPSPSTLSLPSSTCFLFSALPRFQAHQLAPPSSSPPVSESLFMTSHVSELTNPLLPLPPLQLVSPRF